MAKQLLFDDHARARMLRGIDTLADAVAVTMGPTGRNVIINKSFGGPSVTKDGVTVAKEIELEDRFENMGAKLVVEVAQKTSDLAGDGTTTATVLARAIFKEGLRNIVAGSNPTAIRRGIDKAVQAAVEHLTSMAKGVSSKDEVTNVGAQEKTSGWVEIPTGYVGVITMQTDNPNLNMVAGIQDKVLQPGLYPINPKEQQIDIINVGYRDTSIQVENQIAFSRCRVRQRGIDCGHGRCSPVRYKQLSDAMSPV